VIRQVMYPMYWLCMALTKRWLTTLFEALAVQQYNLVSCCGRGMRKKTEDSGMTVLSHHYHQILPGRLFHFIVWHFRLRCDIDSIISSRNIAN
jgi:hypothetical protein